MLLFLLSICDERDHPKIEYIYNTYHDDMLRYAKSRLKNTGDFNYELNAEDVTQNAFIKIAKYIDKIDVTVSEIQLRSYLFTIIANEASSYLAQNEPTESFEACEELVSDEDFVERLNIQERYREVVGEIEGLKERYRHILLYYFFEQMSIKEMAEFMEIPEKTVYTRLERGKRLLIEKMEGNGDA